MLANECSGVGHGQRKLVAKAATWSFIYRQALYLGTGTGTGIILNL